MNKAVIYTRVAGENPEVTEKELLVQSKRCREYAEQKGYTVVDEFTDTTHIGTQPNFWRMMEQVKKGKFDLIIVNGLDRITRNRSYYYDLIFELYKHDVCIAIVEQIGGDK